MDEDGRPAAWQSERDAIRLVIVDALLDALDRWEELSAVVATADDRAEAVALLTGPQFGYGEQAAQHVLDMRVEMRTAANRSELEDERRGLASGLGG